MRWAKGAAKQKQRIDGLQRPYAVYLPEYVMASHHGQPTAPLHSNTRTITENILTKKHDWGIWLHAGKCYEVIKDHCKKEDKPNIFFYLHTYARAIYCMVAFKWPK